MTPKANPAILQFLRQGAWFAMLPVPLQELIVDRSIARCYRADQAISLEESAPTGLFVVLEGRVRVARTMPNGDEALYTVGEPGFWFGELALLAAQKTAVSVTATAPTRALLLTKAGFDRIVEDDPRNYRWFALLLAERYAAVLRGLADAYRLAPLDRLRARLAEEIALHRSARPVAGAVLLSLSQTDLAGMIGVSRQTLNKLLHGLQREGLVDVGYRHIRVLEPARLLVSDEQVPASNAGPERRERPHPRIGRNR